jgi:hypothetical protein
MMVADVRVTTWGCLWRVMKKLASIVILPGHIFDDNISFSSLLTYL